MRHYLRARVEGVVQGVGFRYFVARRAEQLSLVGYVKNLPDGAVLVEAEGSKASLERLCELLRSGPPSASVDRVETSWGESQGRFSKFEVRF